MNQHTFCKHNGFKLEMCYVIIQNVIKKTNFRLKDIFSLRHSFIYLDLSTKLCSSKLFMRLIIVYIINWMVYLWVGQVKHSFDKFMWTWKTQRTENIYFGGVRNFWLINSSCKRTKNKPRVLGLLHSYALSQRTMH